MRSIFKKSGLIFLSVLLMGSIKSVIAQTNFYDLNVLQKIEINFSQTNWDYQLDTAKSGAEEYIMAASVTINGSTYDSVGVKYKGNSSYDSTYKKNPIHIAIDEFKSQAYQGYTDIKLGNGYADPSQIREVMGYNILKNYMDCPRSNFAQLYINGEYYGVYSNAESINKDFCSEHFYSSENTFVKCNPTVIPGPTTKSNLKFKPALDSSAYFNFYEIKSKAGWNDLVALCDSVTNQPTNVSAVMDVDRAIWMIAFNNVLVNLDSYSGVFSQNYYLYKDNTNHYNPVIWDLNMCLGGFPFSGSGATGMGSLSVANMQQLPLTLHSTDAYWPLIKALLSDATYKRMFVAHMRTIVNEFFANNSYQTLAQQLQTLVDTALASDSNNFFSYSQFQNGMTANNTIGSYIVPGITNLMSARVSYLQATTDFLAAPPSITAVTASNLSPNLNSIVTVTANVANANSNAVFLGYRLSNVNKFERVLMYDDGVHNDGNANDNVFGASILMSAVQVQYYLYAENSSAGIFSPERAEHEYYSLQVTIQTPTIGQVVINEFLANNVTDTTDAEGNHSDWIEFYNTTNDTLNLFGLMLSDSYTNPAKFSFPLNSLVLPNGYLIVWADDKSANSGSSIHCNFKLSQNGERLVLSNNQLTPLDSITFGPQAADVSYARCPNGTGGFTAQTQSTFNASNCPSAVPENGLYLSELNFYPNPASSIITVKSSPFPHTIEIYDAYGQLMLKQIFNGNIQLNCSKWVNGIYFLKVANQSRKILIQN